MKWLARTWFPLALIALALCAVPGIILVVLRLFGADGPLNAWLLDNWRITYDLRVAPWVALILLALPIVLVILYFLKLKRKPIQVPSTFLWKKSIEDLHVNSLFQWLRNNVLLVLQLLVLLFLIYAVLGVRIHGSVGTSRHYILLIDNSASMSAKDGTPTRLDWAKAEALKEIDAASDSDFGMVLVFNSKATTLQTYTNDREKLRDAIRGIEQTQRPTRIDEALALAQSLANPVRSTEDAAMQPEDVPEDQRRTLVAAAGISTIVHLYSDGRFAKLSEATLGGMNAQLAGNASPLGNLNLHYHMAGKIAEAGHTNNLAIVAINVLRRQAPAAKKSGTKQQLLAFARVANYRSKAAKVRLLLDVHIDGELMHPLQRVVDIKPRKFKADEGDDEGTDEPGEAEALFPLPAIEAGRHVVLHAYLDKPGDDFALDDQAWLVVGTSRKARVLIVGEANRFLDAFFEPEETRKYASAERMAPAELATDKYKAKARSGAFDLVIFDRCAPKDETDMPLANTFFIDRPPPPWRKGENVLKDPLVLPSKVEHPLLRHLTTIWDVRAGEAFHFDVKANLTPDAANAWAGGKRVLPPVTRIIEASNQAPLLFSLPRGPHTDLVMAFPLVNDAGDVVSNWGLEVSFPLFFRNVLNTLGNVEGAKGAVQIAPGEPMVLRPEAGFRFVKVTAPDGRVTRLERGPRHDVLFADTEQLGVYCYQVGASEKADQADVFDNLTRGFAVNLLDANESNIEPRLAIRIGTERIVAGEEKFQTREVWKWILVVALLLLMAEWLIYHRRIAV